MVARTDDIGRKEMSEEHAGWREHRKLILARLEEHGKALCEMRLEISRLREGLIANTPISRKMLIYLAIAIFGGSAVGIGGGAQLASPSGSASAPIQIVLDMDGVKKKKHIDLAE
jgi:hypothetical protein